VTATFAFFVMAVLVVALLLLERWPNAPRVLYGIAKLSASTLFVGYGIFAVLRDNVIDVADAYLLLAFLLCLVGDGLLVPRGSKGFFLGGLLFFLLGHVTFVVAFFTRGVEAMSFCGSGVVALVLGVGVMAWLRPHLRGVMAFAVPVYVVVIGAMVSAAVGAVAAARGAGHIAPSTILVVGTCCFWVSDLAVARERFVRDGYVNRVVGIPLYFLAQLLIAHGWQK
jgi:uncharacterized membrane protein YhhN